MNDGALDRSGVHPGYVAELAGGDFQECFDANSGRGFEAGLGLDGGGDALGESSARGERHVESAGEEAFEDLKVGCREFGYAMIREREASGRFRCGDGGGEDIGREGARGLCADGGFFNAIADDEGSGGEIAEALVVAGNEDGDGSHRVEEGELVNVADEVAGHGFEEADCAAGTLDDADAGDALAGGAAIPEGLKQGEVAPVKQEEQEEVEGGCPLRGEVIEGIEAGQEEREDPDNKDETDDPDEVVDQKCDEPAADAGERHVNGDKLGCFNAKLI